MNIETYYNKLKEKIDDKELNNFWIICKRTDFKPIKNKNKKEIKNYINDKLQYYKNKNISNIKFYFKNIKDFDKLDDDNYIFTIKIYIYKINNDGDIDINISDTWSLVISYNKDELINNHFTFEELKQMIEMASNRKIISDLGGMSYTYWKKNLNKLS